MTTREYHPCALSRVSTTRANSIQFQANPRRQPFGKLHLHTHSHFKSRLASRPQVESSSELQPSYPSRHRHAFQQLHVVGEHQARRRPVNRLPRHLLSRHDAGPPAAHTPARYRDLQRRDMRTIAFGRSMRLKVPPTRNHRQLASWINQNKLVDDRGRPVVARVDRVRTSTDTKVAGTRFRRIGRDRQGLVLEIWLIEKPSHLPYAEARLYRHESSETYRRHAEARAWVEQNLRKDRS